MSQQQNFCANCGAPVTSDMTTCPNCGATLKPVVVSTDDRPPLSLNALAGNPMKVGMARMKKNAPSKQGRSWWQFWKWGKQ
ncbi:zinc ribbon domain-containing protein [Secundilactobacillus kimchicus]|nr:zinc-ribbon domain-containing protein [Secundilactobacillus kimchicus]MBT9672029.1 zinc-ribbon domain-containing protein [Secundilactobacillus kimchicus]